MFYGEQPGFSIETQRVFENDKPLVSLHDKRLREIDSVILSGDVFKDAYNLAEAHGIVPVEVASAVAGRDKEAVIRILKEWLGEIDQYLVGVANSHATEDQPVRGKDQLVILKRRELIKAILDSAK